MHTCVFEDYTVFFLLKYQSHYTAPFSLLLTQYIPFITEQWINKTNIYQKNSSGSRCLELYSFYFVVVNVTNLLFFVGLFFFVTLRFIKGIYILFDLYVNVSFVLFFWYGNPWNASTVIPHTCCHGRRMLSCPPLRTQQVACCSAVREGGFLGEIRIMALILNVLSPRRLGKLIANTRVRHHSSLTSMSQFIGVL